MTSWLNPYRWLLVGGLIAAMVAGYFAWASHQQGIGYQKAKSEYTASALVAEQAARTKEQALQSQVTKAIQDAQIRSKTLQAAADSARAQSDGLRNQLTAARNQLSRASKPALIEYADTAGVVLAACVREYSDLAKAADGHSSDAVMLVEGWPK